MENIKNRLLSKIIIDDETGCWNWLAGKDKNGYGKIVINKRHLMVHRASYYYFVGPFEQDKLICHKCDNPSCINPDHLFIGTWLSNMQDKVNKGRLRNQNMDKTHCKRGHEFTEENTKIKSKGRRTCVICYKERYTSRNKRVLPLEEIQNIKNDGAGKYCKRGHEFTFENTWVSKNGSRSCRTCGLEKNRKSYAAKTSKLN